MKKIMIFAAIAATLSLASCQKEGLNEAVKDDPSAVSESPVFTATISTGSKTTVDAASGKVSWETTDEITVTDKDQKTAVYSIESIDVTTGRAKFVYKSGDTLGEGPYTATYGIAPTTAQTYSATPGKLYMTATATSGTSLEFTVQCGLMEIKLTKTDESVKHISVFGTPTGGAETQYALTCTEAQSIATEKSFYIAVPAGSYNKIVLSDNENDFCILTAPAGISVAANHIKPLTFGTEKLNFTAALPGVFSISNDGGQTIQKVRFAKGNLYYDGENWGFEEAQNYFRTLNDGTHKGGKNDADGLDKKEGTKEGHWGLFCWVGKSCTKYNDEPQVYGPITVARASDLGRMSGESLKKHWGNAIDAKGTWRPMTGWYTGKDTDNEWKYLFAGRVDAAKKIGYATVGGVHGIILLPDSFTDPMKNAGSNSFTPVSAGTGNNLYNGTYADNTYTTGGDWEAMQAAGAVFLPATGTKLSSGDVDDVNDEAHYWSSTKLDSSKACYLQITNTGVAFYYMDDVAKGNPVRLITVVQ